MHTNEDTDTQTTHRCLQLNAKPNETVIMEFMKAVCRHTWPHVTIRLLVCVFVVITVLIPQASQSEPLTKSVPPKHSWYSENVLSFSFKCVPLSSSFSMRMHTHTITFPGAIRNVSVCWHATITCQQALGCGDNWTFLHGAQVVTGIPHDPGNCWGKTHKQPRMFMKKSLWWRLINKQMNEMAIWTWEFQLTHTKRQA